MQRAADFIGPVLIMSFVATGVDAQGLSGREAVELSALTSLDNVEAFVASFKMAVLERSCFKVAALTKFPLRVYWWRPGVPRASRTTDIWNRTALCRYLSVTFSDETTHVVVSQDVLKMPVGYRGLQFGDGRIWITPVCLDQTRSTPCKETQLRFTDANVITPS